jgi:outer membrane protein assembly factor BamD (BamD/ComL family)
MRPLANLACSFFLAGALGGSAGCGWDSFNLLAPDSAREGGPGGDSLVMRGGTLVDDRAGHEGKDPAAGQLGAARELFRNERYSDAEDLFYKVADNKKNSPKAIQEALYYRAECFRLLGKYPKAADLYVKLLNDFPHNPYREQCLKHVFDIANYWLEDTRQEMKEDLEQRQGKRWLVWPRFCNFEKTKPLIDEEGRAVEKLEQVRLHDITGPLADRALFLAGTVKLYHENYRDADHYFSQIHARHPESPLAPKAIELAIYCKHMSTGGPDYDGRKSAEARQLVQAAFRSYPKLAEEKRAFLERQMEGITLEQAQKEYSMAEFYRRTGHPGAAYFYFKLVERRYPGSELAKKAAHEAEEVRARAEKENGGPVRDAAPAMPTIPYRNPTPFAPTPGQAAPAGTVPPLAPVPTPPATLPPPVPLPAVPGSSMPPPLGAPSPLR